MSQFQCQFPYCGKKDALIFHCNYCEGYFCEEHHLPENHACKKIPKIAPSYLRPLEPLKAKEPLTSANNYSYNNSSGKNAAGMKNSHKAILAISIAIVISFFFIFILAAMAPSSPANLTPTPTQSTPNAIPYTSSPTLPTSSYVGVDYRTIGWFYSDFNADFFNYTYLVLNVTITNHGYEQVNTKGSNGFIVSINGQKYSSLYNNPLFLRNETVPFGGYSFYDSELPNPATLLDTGTISGFICFQFGDATIYPRQSQILNEPFTLQYSVSYGKEVTLFPPSANVIVNQK